MVEDTLQLTWSPDAGRGDKRACVRKRRACVFASTTIASTALTGYVRVCVCVRKFDCVVREAVKRERERGRSMVTWGRHLCIVTEGTR